MAITPGAGHWATVELDLGFYQADLHYDLWVTTTENPDDDDKNSIKKGDCDDEDDYCEDTVKASVTGRATTAVALICAAICCFAALGFACCTCCGDEAKSNYLTGFSVLLAVGGLVAVAGAANYKSAMEKAIKDHPFFDEARGGACFDPRRASLSALSPRRASRDGCII